MLGGCGNCCVCSNCKEFPNEVFMTFQMGSRSVGVIATQAAYEANRVVLGLSGDGTFGSADQVNDQGNPFYAVASYFYVNRYVDPVMGEFTGNVGTSGGDPSIDVGLDNPCRWLNKGFALPQYGLGNKEFLGNLDNCLFASFFLQIVRGTTLDINIAFPSQTRCFFARWHATVFRIVPLAPGTCSSTSIPLPYCTRFVHSTFVNNFTADNIIESGFCRITDRRYSPYNGPEPGTQNYSDISTFDRTRCGYVSSPRSAGLWVWSVE